MSKDNYDNGFVNFVLTFVILGGVYQCAKETWAKVEPQVTGFINGVGIVLSSYLFPFAAASLTTGFILNQLCKLPREWGGSPIDFRFSATGISLIAAPVLLYFGIPKCKISMKGARRFPRMEPPSERLPRVLLFSSPVGQVFLL